MGYCSYSAGTAFRQRMRQSNHAFLRMYRASSEQPRALIGLSCFVAVNQ